MNAPIDIITAIVTVYSCLYVLVAVVIAAGILRFRRQKPPDALPSVSIVVCARNEEQSIRQCIESLIKLDYPTDKTEIILVDDESDDATRAIMEEYSHSISHISVLSTEHEPRDLPGKQRPLNLGIRESHGEIILVTDADCTVQPGWVKGHCAAYGNPGIGIAGGITVVSGAYRTLFARVQGAELVSKLGVAMGFTGLGLPQTVMGNNFSIKRDAYESCGGFSAIIPTIVEDMILMKTVLEKTEYRLGWAGSPGSVVKTKSDATFHDIIHQRQRWMTELKNFSKVGKLSIAVEIMMEMVFFISLVIAYGNHLLPVLAGSAWLFGYCAILIAVPGSRLVDFIFIPGAVVFENAYCFALMFRSITGKTSVRWRGRVYDG